MSLVVWGPIGTKLKKNAAGNLVEVTRYGSMDDDQVIDYILAQIGYSRRRDKHFVSNATSVLNDIRTHELSDGGYGTDFTHRGTKVYHKSVGDKGRSVQDSCTLFFTRGQGVLTIVGIGHHAARNRPIYELLWTRHNWNLGRRRIDLDA